MQRVITVNGQQVVCDQNVAELEEMGVAADLVGVLGNVVLAGQSVHDRQTQFLCICDDQRRW